MGRQPRPSWCDNKNSWDPVNGTCFAVTSGAQIFPPDPGSGSDEGVPDKDCKCGEIAYEKGHPCFKECKDAGGGSGDDHEWYLREIKSKPNVFDTGISEGQWIAWRGFWDDATKSFRSENVDQGGNAIGGTGFSKPVDCPDGTTKFNVNQCLPLDDWRITSAWGTQPAGGGSGSGGGGSRGTATTAPTSLAQKQLPYTGNELHDVLVNMFNYRAGIFGTNDPNLSGATPRTPIGKTAKEIEDNDISGYSLPKGGLWWGNTKDLTSALAPFAQTFTSQIPAQPVKAAAVKPTKPAAQTCPAGYQWNASVGGCMPEVQGTPAQPPRQFTGPLERALNKLQ